MSASGALKALVRNFARAVRMMRNEQAARARAGYRASKKERHEQQAKDLEVKVDAMLKQIDYTLIRLN